MTKPVIIDCDPGIDDAVAILLALASNGLEVKLITTCAGNLPSEKITLNALKLLSFVGAHHIEVARGATKPLLKELVVAEEVHGTFGLGGAELGEPVLSLSERSALEAMRDVIMHSEQKVSIVAIGPLTNIALLVKSYPEVLPHIEQLSIMGGSCLGGNCTPVAEFNIYVDPLAAQIVFHAGIPITMFGLNVTHQVPVLRDDIERIRNIGNRTGEAVATMLDFYAKEDRVDGLHDPCAVAYLIDPSLFATKWCNVEVETKGEFTEGQTVVDADNRTNRPKNANVAFEVKRDKLIDMVYEAIKKFN